MRRLLALVLMLCTMLAAPAQSRRSQQRRPTQREQLQQQQQRLRQQRQANQQRQRQLEQRLRATMQDVEALGSDIQDKELVIDSLRLSIDTLNTNIHRLDSQLNVLRAELEERRQHYIQSVRYMYRNSRVQSQILFVLSANNFNQMYRRMRFMNEYTTYQRAQAEAVKQKREQVEVKRTELAQARSHLGTLLARSEAEQQQLTAKKEQQQHLVADLQREQQTVRQLITQQQREEAQLNAQIDRLIAEEIERQRRAEEERRLAEQRRREEQQRRQQQQQAAANSNNNRNNRRNSGRNRGRDNAASASSAPATTAPSPVLPASPDQQLSGSFARNKGRLPIPITGSFRVVRNYGTFTMAGVTLQSSGIHLQGEAGAMARCVFEGEVSKIYNPGNGYVVMVRHGQYISVYCNLSEVSVASGQKVRTNQTLGKVGPSHILVFRLQNWNQTLNPKKWLSRM